MSQKNARQVRKEIVKQTDNAKMFLTSQILTFMEETARNRSFFARIKIALRYIFKKDFRGILGED